jgi:RecA-family ATPase
MPRYIQSNPSARPSLPRSVENYLNTGASEGGRNHALFAAAAQLRDLPMPEEDAIYHLEPRAIADGLPPDEVRSAIASAYKAAPRAPASSLSPTRSVIRPAARNDSRERERERPRQRQEGSIWARARPISLPERVEGGFEKLVMAAFEEGEGICVGGTFEDNDGNHKPESGVVLTREKWLEKVNGKRAAGDLGKVLTGKNGIFIRVNPMRVDPKSKNTDADVSKWRHVLLEFDLDPAGKRIPKDRQLGAILASNLPVTAVLDSGDKSIHAWVRVDAKSAAEYKDRAEEIYELFDSGVDTQNCNPSRYSRCPDGHRTVNGDLVKQSLLKVKVGAESWDEWKRLTAVHALGEPWRPLKDFEDYDIANDPNTVIGDRWLCRGGSLVLVSQSGVGKSSMQMQLKVGWAIGNADMTFGMIPIKPLKQLTIQAENDQGDVAQAWQDTTRGFGLSMAEKIIADQNCLWHRITTLTGPEFLDTVEGLIQLHQPDICWIDPLINYIGDDMSKAEVISNFCVAGLSTISLKTGVIFALIHHTGKPKDSAYKSGMTASDLAYSGLGSSNLTNWAREVMVLSRVKTADPNEPATFTLTATKRRSRAGMKTIPVNGDPADVVATSEIYVRHSPDGRIRWEQCPEPEMWKPKTGRPKGERTEKSGETESKRGPGRACSLSAVQKQEIFDRYHASGCKLSGADKNELGEKFSKSAKTIGNYVDKVEIYAAKEGIKTSEALAKDIADSAH